MTLLLLEPYVAPRNLHRNGKSLDIPFPWARGRLVEVVDVEHETFGRRIEDAEVAYVRISYALHRNAGGRGAGEIVRHDRRAPSVEGEGVCAHALEPQRHRSGTRILFCSSSRPDHVTPLRLHAPYGMRGEREAFAEFETGVRAILGVLELRPCAHVEHRMRFA